MLVEPEVYISFLKDKNYKYLIKKRDDLLYEIKEYEDTSDDSVIKEFGMIPSKELVYEYNHLYLSKICELIAEKYRMEIEGEE